MFIEYLEDLECVKDILSEKFQFKKIKVKKSIISLRVIHDYCILEQFGWFELGRCRITACTYCNSIISVKSAFSHLAF